MSQLKLDTSLSLKRIKPRYITINEDIHAALDLYTLSLYIALRYEADYTKDDAVIRRSAKFLYTKAKIKRAQYYISINKLESHGLIIRDKNSKLGEKCIFHVAQDLGYFTPALIEIDRGVHVVDRGVHDMDTDQYSIPLITTNIISDSDESPMVAVDEIVQTYHEELPDLPRIKVVDSKLKAQLTHMRKNWHKYQKDGKKFSIESFRDYLRYIKLHYDWFIKPYTTQNGNVRRNNLRVLTREVNIARIVNGEFNAS